MFISFDLIRPGEIEKPLAIATILAFLKSDSRLQDTMSFHHISINSLSYGSQFKSADIEKHLYGIDIEKFDFIALSAYVWNEYLLNDLIKHLRKLGFIGKIILGGYQITYSDQPYLSVYYPDAQVFISGYAEQSLINLFNYEFIPSEPLYLNNSVDFSNLPSPYLSNEIAVTSGVKMLRLETKRGCPYRCSFCAHRDLTKNKVFKHSLEKVFNEISLIVDRNVGRVNILDPIFNAGNEYLEVMREINSKKSSTVFTLQTRFENIKGEVGNDFLDLCASGKYHLEFGMQTAVSNEADIINRKNNLKQIDSAFDQLNERNISYEVSLIYGLPGQTIDSFMRSIEYVQSKGCKSIKAYPLMLLRGTELYHEKEKWKLNEEAVGEFSIPVVTSSTSFSRKDWEKMNELAAELTRHDRV